MNNRSLPFLLAAALTLSLSNGARAQFEEMSSNYAEAAPQWVDGIELYKHRANKDWTRAYLAGVMDAGAADGDGHMRYCLPADGTLDEYTEVFIGYLAANPQMRNKPGSELVRDSLGAAYACKSSPAIHR